MDTKLNIQWTVSVTLLKFCTKLPLTFDQLENDNFPGSYQSLFITFIEITCMPSLVSWKQSTQVS